MKELYMWYKMARREFGMTPAEALAWAKWDPFEQGSHDEIKQCEGTAPEVDRLRGA